MISKRSIKREATIIEHLKETIVQQQARIKELELALEAAGVPICKANEYPPVPQNVELFQHHYGFRKPVIVHQWGWSFDFNCWRALVTFEDGWYGWTYPCTFSMVTP